MNKVNTVSTAYSCNSECVEKHQNGAKIAILVDIDFCFSEEISYCYTTVLESSEHEKQVLKCDSFDNN